MCEEGPTLTQKLFLLMFLCFMCLIMNWEGIQVPAISIFFYFFSSLYANLIISHNARLLFLLCN